MKVSIDRLRQSLTYCAETGVISRASGGVATYPHSKNRRRLSVCVGSVQILAHRAAWAIHFGEWPSGEIDHINGDEADNRMKNLRDVSKSVNQQNKRKPRSDNTCGFLGVGWHKAAKKWRAQISISGRVVYLGLFDEPEIAHAAYLDAKRRIHPGFVG